MSFISDEKSFFKNDLNEMIRTIQTINSVYDKFTTTFDMHLLRADSNVENIDNNSTIQYDNFISTTGSYKFINSPKIGVEGRGIMEITIPAGSHFIPMDLISEYKMDADISAEDSFGDNSVKTDECEILLPMSVMKIEKYIGRDGIPRANVTTMKELSANEILKYRINELREQIIQYCGKEEDEKISNIINNAQEKEVDFEDTNYIVSKEQIGKRTINKETPFKDASQNRTNIDIIEFENTKEQGNNDIGYDVK